MNSQRRFYRNVRTHPREFGGLVDFPLRNEDSMFGDPLLQDQGEPPVPPPYTVLGSPPTYNGTHHPTAPPTLSPWWETEAREILCSQQFQLIQRLLRFRLYGQKDSLRHTLQHCWTCKLDKILVLLKDNEQPLPELEKNQKVDKIMELVDTIRDFSHVGWRWAPYNAADMDAEQIAANIDEESYSLFRRIRFEDWVRHLAGYEVESVDDLFFQHRILTHKIRCYLLRHRNEREKYIQVTEVTRLT